MTKKTQTSTFGVSEKVNHDSSNFYNSNLYQTVKLNSVCDCNESVIDENKLNVIYNHS